MWRCVGLYGIIHSQMAQHGLIPEGIITFYKIKETVPVNGNIWIQFHLGIKETKRESEIEREIESNVSSFRAKQVYTVTWYMNCVLYGQLKSDTHQIPPQFQHV